MPLERELAYFNAHLGEWLQHHAGKFALVVGEELIGVFDDPERAYGEGISKFGNVPMLIRRIEENPPVASFPALSLGLLHVHS